MENNNEIISEENKTEEENIKEQNVGSENNKKGRLLDDILEIAENYHYNSFYSNSDFYISPASCSDSGKINAGYTSA